jgi:periplasmic divalent cation tolerance protein
MSDCVQVLTTAGSEEEAGEIASLLVERRLAACVQVVGPIVAGSAGYLAWIEKNVGDW